MVPSWHLAIESSGLGGSAALFRYDRLGRGVLHTQHLLPGDRGSVQTLAPAIQQSLREAQIAPNRLNSLSVTAGPGSFTGLRVGLATAKILAWTLNIPAVPVDTLEAIACRFIQGSTEHRPDLPSEFRLVTAINAFRRQVFTSSWTVIRSEADLRLECCLPSQVIDAQKWLADPWQLESSTSETPLFVTGGAIASYPGLENSAVILAHSQLWQPLAEQVGLLGLKALAEGRAVTADQLIPNYIRSSAAEENARK